jgi:hypothetical protein
MINYTNTGYVLVEMLRLAASLRRDIMKKTMLKLLAVLLMLGTVTSLTTAYADAPGGYQAFDGGDDNGNRGGRPACFSCN